MPGREARPTPQEPGAGTPGPVLPAWLTEESAVDHRGQVEEPMLDESIGTVARGDVSSSADLDGAVPDDAVAEARESWWEPEPEAPRDHSAKP